MPKQRILIVEDDGSIARVLRDNLTLDGFEVDCAFDGLSGLARVEEFRPDLVLLDLMLPGVGGLEVCRLLSERPTRTPIIILTARSQQHDKIEGLQLGADDYVTKPFSLDELLARVHAVLRRTQRKLSRLTVGATTVDFNQRRAVKEGVDLALTQRELDVLQYLAEHADRVVSRDELLRAVWGYREHRDTRAVDNLVARLRRKIEKDPHRPGFIQTVYGDGYRLTYE